MSYTMEDFKRDMLQKYLREVTVEERREVLESLPVGERRPLLEALPPEERLAGISAEQIQQYLAKLTHRRSTGARKPRRRK